MISLRRIVGIIAVFVLVGSAYGGDLSIDTKYYSVSGLFTNPLIPAEAQTVKITVRATIEGEITGKIKANVSIATPGGEVINKMVSLKLDKKGTTATEWVPAKRKGRFRLGNSKKTATGFVEWKALSNGQYFVTATLDPNNEIAESNENNNVGTIELPVVIDGRQPHFPWYGSEKHLRWATIWSCSGQSNVEQWRERGVKALAFKGAKIPEGGTANTISEGLQKNIEYYDGIGIDECGGYLTQATLDYYKLFMAGLKNAKEKHPDKFFYVWHSGSSYPEQTALYRGRCDLVVAESYVFYWGPLQLGRENIYNSLDARMLPAWQADLLVPTGKGTQFITSVDLTNTGVHKGSLGAFNRGKMEAIVRHLRRKWPEMRGLGFYHSTASVADDQFIESLLRDYFIMPLVTVLPGNLWVNKQDDGSYLITAAVSNIGGMDSGPVAVNIYVDGKLLKATMVPKVPAGNNLLENQLRIEAPWKPQSGGYDLMVKLGPVSGSTVLDHKQTTTYYVP
ncbi:CARDB domain-containing protein [Planctomycetota bacterium]